MALSNVTTRWIYNNCPTILRNYLTSLYSKNRGKVKFGFKFDEYLTDLERTQWYTTEQLYAIQSEKLRRILWQAYSHVPFYKNAFKNLSFRIDGTNTINTLKRLEIIDKTVVQSNQQSFRSTLYNDPKTVEIIHSSGTSGKPIDVVVENGYFKMEKAYLWLQRKWLGLKPGDRTAYFTGHPVVPIRNKKPPFWVFDSVEKRTFFSLQHISNFNLIFYAKELLRFQPQLIVGYPNAIYLVASYLCDNNITGITPRGIFTASETLMPHQRIVIEKAFNCKILDLYGQTEYCGMIMQCDCGNYHIQEEYGVIEILDNKGNDSQPGVPGELVCTGLNNLAMPFIRYRTNDMAILKDGVCSCGRGGRLIERIYGRMEDLIITPDGRYISRLDFVFKEIQNVLESQIIQETVNHIRIRIVPRVSTQKINTDKVLANLRERIGNDVKFEIEILDQIPRLANGKFRYVVSKAPVGNTGIWQTGMVIGVTEEESKTL